MIFRPMTIVLLLLPACCPGWLPAQPPGRPGIPPLLRMLDADGDHVLSAGEIENAAEKLNAMDASKDGRVTTDEMREALRSLISQRPNGPGERGNETPSSRGGGSASESDFENPLLAVDEEEEKILGTLEEMQQGDRFRNVSTTDGRLLRLLAETTDAKKVVEIGTSTGESAVWLALGLRKTGGHLYTHEIDEERAETARANFEKAGVADQITLILGDAHETVEQHEGPIDILFLDADKEGYIDYLNKLVPLLRPGGLIVAHNMNTRQADPRYLEAITKDPKFETLFLLKEGTGVGVTMKKR